MCAIIYIDGSISLNILRKGVYILAKNKVDLFYIYKVNSSTIIKNNFTI
nr:MAG TPA: hypothetical protein [Caudoviricetes sp.]